MSNKSIDNKFVEKATGPKIEAYTVKVGGTNKSGKERTITMGKYQDSEGNYKWIKNL